MNIEEKKIDKQLAYDEQGEEAVFQGQAKKQIISSIARLRSDKYTAIKRAFTVSNIYLSCFWYIMNLVLIVYFEKEWLDESLPSNYLMKMEPN